MLCYSIILLHKKFELRKFYMKDLKIALEKFESAKSSLIETLSNFDAKKILSAQEDLKILKEKNKVLKLGQSETKEKINKLLLKIEQIIGNK